MESFCDITCRQGGAFAFRTTLMEPILAAPLPGTTTLQVYIAMKAATRRPYYTFYKNLIITIIMTKNCGYGSLRKWLAQNHMGPNG